ncbi:CoA transferase [Rhodococcoides yunnanense]|uniref:CoA transferase n=1 Tax=Rhodococcoides yunnanense TaxID=278209 RepID=A0ABU4BK90_9NOCA|nr:CoA transferase [Rhodococcus yunnanensis]MDV6264643.1 CoA transferase [Rhodococcus yunnanensis]
MIGTSLGEAREPSDSVARWARNGLAALTGDPASSPDFSRAGILGVADTAAAPFGVPVEDLLAGRAALTGKRRQGRVSLGGKSRLVLARDAWFAITLARDSDVESVAALFTVSEKIDDPWAHIARAAPDWIAAELVERAQLLGIPAAKLGEAHGPAIVASRLWTQREPSKIDHDLLVVDLSAMWAGPLCGHLLNKLGATVVKVESPNRPDGARSGNPDFFRWMNVEKRMLSTTLSDTNVDVAALMDEADVVIESSRPRALQHLGLDAHSRRPRPGRVWVRITGYGQAIGAREKVAFGDDAAVAGGLVGYDRRGPVFCGDAIADPLSGLEAAYAVTESLARGGGELIDVSMAGVAAKYASVPTCAASSNITPSPPRRPTISSSSWQHVDAPWVRHVIEKRTTRC